LSITPLISADTGDGAAGCASAARHERQEARLGAESAERQEERRSRPGAGQGDSAHRAERVVAGAALQHAEAEQDGDRADVRNDEVQEACAAYLRDAVLRRDQEERRQRHRFPGHHEQVRVVRDEHERHRRQECVVLKADESRRSSFARTEIAGRKDRDRRAGCAQQQQEEGGQRIEAKVKRQLREPERQHRR
jgi:hypothetical protein